MFDFVTRSQTQTYTQTLRHIKNSFLLKLRLWGKLLQEFARSVREKEREMERLVREQSCADFTVAAASSVVVFIVRATMSLLHRPQSFIVVVFAQYI